MRLRTPLRVVLGRGAAGEGAAHWWAQRLSALALLPLTLWFMAALLQLPLRDYAAVTIWIASGWNPVWLALLLLALCWHSRLGIQVIVEDYVHSAPLKFAALTFNDGAHVALAVAGGYALLRIALRSAL